MRPFSILKQAILSLLITCTSVLILSFFPNDEKLGSNLYAFVCWYIGRYVFGIAGLFLMIALSASKRKISPVLYQTVALFNIACAIYVLVSTPWPLAPFSFYAFNLLIGAAMLLKFYMALRKR